MDFQATKVECVLMYTQVLLSQARVCKAISAHPELLYLGLPHQKSKQETSVA